MSPALAAKFRALSELAAEIAAELERDEAPPPKKSRTRRKDKPPKVTKLDRGAVERLARDKGVRLQS